jgi:hypothetical protein
METMERKKPPCPRRSFTPEFKAEIVELCRQGDRSIGQVPRTSISVRPRCGPGFTKQRSPPATR